VVNVFFFNFREFWPPNLGRKRFSLQRMWKTRMLIWKERETPQKYYYKFLKIGIKDYVFGNTSPL
jgi:hypothetical protein